jgi:hypothetical protein
MQQVYAFKAAFLQCGDELRDILCDFLNHDDALFPGLVKLSPNQSTATN